MGAGRDLELVSVPSGMRALGGVQKEKRKTRSWSGNWETGNRQHQADASVGYSQFLGLAASVANPSCPRFSL